jgi:hypothetical protein
MGLPKKRQPHFSFSVKKLFLSGSVNRTSVCAATAADALVSVDYVLAVSLGDAAGRTSVSASAAADALIGNLVCHFKKLNLILLPIF